MPPLRLFNRSWHISSDDLVLPAWVGVAFHGTWTSLIAAEVIIIGLPDDCAGRSLATSSVLWLLISFALTTLLQCVVAGIAMRGAMLEEHKRAAMPTALYCLLSAYALEAAALVYATIVNFGLLADTIGSCHTAEELARTTISELSLHRWFVGSTWGMLIAICGLLVLMYNLYPDRGLESWEKRVNCMSYILCCRKSLTADADDDGSAAASAPTVVRLARVFGDLFYPLNFSFTDTVAAITLVGITHRSSAHGHGSSSHNHALIAAAGAGVLSAGSKTEAAVPGAGALLEAAVAAAAAAARQKAAAAADGDAAGQLDGSSHTPRPGAVCSAGPAVNGVGAVEGMQQELQLAARAASPFAAGAVVDTPQQRSPSPALKGIKHSSSTGNVQSAAAAAALTRGSSPTPLEPVGVSLPRSASNSAWEAAVRQGSALAVAPGRGVVPGGNSSRPTSPAPDAAALPARSHSTAVDTAAALQPRGPSPSRFNQRAVSWGGGSGGGVLSSQPVSERSSEQGSAASSLTALGAVHPHSGHRPQPAVLSSLAEANELSLAHSNVLGQVESLLSPLASEEAAVAPPAGAAAAGDAVGSVGGGVVGSDLHINPLFSDRSGQLTEAQAAQQAGHARQQQQPPDQQGLCQGGVVPGAVVGSAACVTVAGAAAAAAAAAAGGDEALGDIGAVNAAGQPVGLELLEEALHWHAYANAIYGWPMFLWSHRYRVLRCCRLCCGGCCKGVPEGARSSGGGLGVQPHHMHTPLALSSTDTGSGSKGASAAAGKALVGSQGQGGSFGSSRSNGTHAAGVTTIVTLSSVDTDSVSPGSTCAGGSSEATATGPCMQQQQLQVCGPVAEGLEEAAACAQGDSDAAAAAASGCWDVEQGGVCVNGAKGGAAAAAAASCSPAPRGSGSSIAVRSRRWVQSSGNIWLLQGLADALGISRESATVVADTAVLSPHGSAQAAAGTAAAVGGGGSGGGGRQPRLSSAAGGLWADAGPCGCMCGGKWGESHVPKMAPLTASQRLTNEAIMQTANIPAADLLYVNYNNLVEGLLPYSVVLDAARRCVVVAIRGSLSVEDCVTDILYDPAPLDEDWLLQQPAAAPAPAEPCQAPDAWRQQAQEEDAVAVAAAAGGLAAAQQQEGSQQLDWPPAPALEAALQAAAANVPVPGRSLADASSGGGSFRSTSMKASPFASAAAAASVAARTSSSGAEALGAPLPRPPPAAAAALPPLPSVQQSQQPLQGGLSQTPSVSVPAAQAAAAAAAAAGRPLPPGNRPLRRHWSVNFGALQEHHQQQQQAGGKLSEQPSFVRRASASLRQRAQQQQQDGDGEQQQQLVSRPSVLESALSVLLGPWRRLTGSDTGDGWHRQQHQHHRQTDTDAAAEEGRVGGTSSRQRSGAAAAGAGKLGSFRGRVAGGSTEGQEPRSGSGTPRQLFKTLSLNLGTALAGGGGRGGPGGQQQQGATGVRRRMAATTSSRLLGGGRDQGGGLLQSYASEHIPSGSSAGSCRTTADSWRTSQTRRTTAADRALGAARAGHRYAPMTSPATDQSAAAAAARDRSFMQQLHQKQQRQQQQQQQALSAMPSMRSTAPASSEPSITAAAMAAAAAAAAGTGAASEPGMPPALGVNTGAGGPTQWPAAAVEGRASGDAHGSPGGVRSRRSTFTQLPRINSGAGAVGDQQQQQQLTMMASVPAALHSQQQQQHWTAGDAWQQQRPASDDGGGGSVGGGTSSSSAQRPSLLSTVSEAAWRHTRRLGLPLPLPLQQRPRQQQQLLDGGPTDWSLLSGAATMVPSRTAAVPHTGALPPAAGSGSGAAGLLSKSYSVGFSSNSRRGTGAGQGTSALLGTSFSARPPAPGTPSGASLDGRSGPSSVAAGSTCEGGTQVASSAAAAAAAGELVGHHPMDDALASPFMQHQQALLLETELGTDPFSAAAAHPSVNQALHQQQQDGQWVLQPLSDGSGEGESDAAAAAEAALADEAEAAAAAEADAVAAAAQAAAAEETPDTGAAGDQWFAHEGILNCARAIRDDLDRLGLLDQLLLGPQQHLHTGSSDAAGASKQQQQQAEAEEGRFMRSEELPDCRGWTLMLTGHSLGAGVAALLALHYRARYGSVRAWCFAPPGGLMSPAAAASLKDICYSLVSAKDMIPRMSLWTIERLRDEMMICALRCKMPKYKLLLGAAFGKKWEEGEVLRPLEQLSQAQVAAFQEYRQEVVEERSLDPLRVRIAREFVPPGEVLWLERNKQLQPRLRVPNTTLTTRPTGASAAMGASAAGAAAAGDQPASLGAVTTATGAPAAADARLAQAPAAEHSAAAVGAAAGGSNSSSGARGGGGFASSRSSTSMLRGGSAALEAAAVAVAGKRLVTRLHPHVTDGLGIIVGGMVVSRNMFADHVPDKQLAQLKRLVRYLRRQQALGRALPEGITPVVLAAPPAQQGIPPRTRM